MRTRIFVKSRGHSRNETKGLTAKVAKKGRKGRKENRFTPAFLCVLRGLSLATFAVKSFTAGSKKLLPAKTAKVDRKDRKGAYSCAIKLAMYPTPNVTAVPIITHHVHGTCVPSHRYNSIANPHTIPTIAPR